MRVHRPLPPSLLPVPTSRYASCTRFFLSESPVPRAPCSPFSTMLDVAQGHLFGTIFEAILYGWCHLFFSHMSSSFPSCRAKSLLQSPSHPSSCKFQIVLLRSRSLTLNLSLTRSPPFGVAEILGIYFTLFVICLFVFDNNKQSTNQVVKYTVIVMFVISTAHIVSTASSAADCP